MEENIYLVYRIEHISSGLGPFQHGMSQKTKNILKEYWSNIDNVSSKFPPPTEDLVILSNSNIPQNRQYKFACLKEEDIYEWLGEKTVASLMKEGFIIKEYKKNIDFDALVLGTNQVVIFIQDY